jgi:hypothetical protein
MRRLAPIALLLAAACVVPLRTVVPPEELAPRRPEDRSGVMVGDELVRLTWSPLYKQDWRSHGPASFEGFANSNDDDGFFPLVIASRVEGGKAVRTFDGGAPQWQDGLINQQEDVRPALRVARDGAAFRTPIRASLGGEERWAVGDLLLVEPPVPEGGSPGPGELLATLELHRVDPRLTSAQEVRPLMVQFVARRPLRGGEEVRRDPATLGLFPGRGGYFRISRLERSPEGQLRAIEFAPWKPDIRAVIGGQHADTVPGGYGGSALPMERALTNALLEWKTRDLPSWLAASTPGKLDDAIIEAEKGMLQLDLRSRLIKDQIDANARGGSGVQPVLVERVQLIDQRKTLIGVVLGSFKAARVQAR